MSEHQQGALESADVVLGWLGQRLFSPPGVFELRVKDA